MNYEQAWKDLKKQIYQEIDEIEGNKKIVNGREYRRLKAKLIGLNSTLFYINRIEKQTLTR